MVARYNWNNVKQYMYFTIGNMSAYHINFRKYLEYKNNSVNEIYEA